MRSLQIKQIGLRAALIGLASAGLGSICLAQEIDSGPTQRPVMTVTAGQGGYIRLPDLRPAESSYSLTGRRDYTEGARAWQQAAGPVMHFGNATIVLPQAR